MKLTIGLILSLMVILDARSNELPHAPIPHIALAVEQPRQVVKPFHWNKKLYVGEITVLGAALAADEITTVHQVYKPGQFETNPILGRHPSELRISAYGTAELLIGATVGYVAEHNRHKVVRFAGRALIAGSIFNHAQAATCNATRNVNAVCKDYPIGLF